MRLSMKFILLVFAVSVALAMAGSSDNFDDHHDDDSKKGQKEDCVQECEDKNTFICQKLQFKCEKDVTECQADCDKQIKRGGENQQKCHIDCQETFNVCIKEVAKCQQEVAQCKEDCGKKNHEKEDGGHKDGKDGHDDD